MAELDRVIENPVSGERVTFLVLAEETDNEYVKIRNEVVPGAVGPPLHRHFAYQETFTVVEGTMDFFVGGRKHRITLGEGESVRVPIGETHGFRNNSSRRAVFDVEMRPAGRFEQSMRASFGVARDGRVTKSGIPTNPFELALLYELSESQIAGVPRFLQTGVFAALAKVARWRGYDPDFPQYTRPT
jgi:mannose-6-phosphate isomerase-like protein (cupin superfamily)